MKPALQARNKGALLVEVLVALSVVAASITLILGASALILRVTTLNLKTIQAGYLLEEAAEIARFVRDDDWSAFSAHDTFEDFAIVPANGTWSFVSTTTEDVLGGGVRTVVFEPVYRDASDRIAESGSLDPNSRSIVVSVEFPVGSTSTLREARTYLSNIHE